MKSSLLFPKWWHEFLRIVRLRLFVSSDSNWFWLFSFLLTFIQNFKTRWFFASWWINSKLNLLCLFFIFIFFKHFRFYFLCLWFFFFGFLINLWLFLFGFLINLWLFFFGFLNISWFFFLFNLLSSLWFFSRKSCLSDYLLFLLINLFSWWCIFYFLLLWNLIYRVISYLLLFLQLASSFLFPLSFKL